MRIVARYEQPSFTITTRRPGYEIRHYASHLVAETVVEGSFESTGNTAFRRLAGYIFGRNSDSSRMNMTVPVTLQPSGVDRHRYRFMMERAYTEDTLPEPLDHAIEIVSVPAGLYAVGRYRGGRRERLFRTAEAQLLRALERDGIEVIGSAELAVYSGPATPSILKRNEVMVPVAAG